MSGKGIEDLKLPPKRFRPNLSTERADGEIRFPTLGDVEEENGYRVRMLEQASWPDFDCEDYPEASGEAEALSKKLAAYEAYGTVAKSPTSAIYMRRKNLCLAGHLWKLGEKVGYEDRAFTIMPKSWRIPAEQLPYFDPVRILKTLYAMLWAYGGDRATGYLIAGLHGEFVEPAELWAIHLHGIVHGEMIGVLDALRDSKKFKGYTEIIDGEPKKRRPIRIQRELMTNRPDAYTYCSQSFWPSRVYIDGESGELRRGPRRRIPEPHHTAWLLWLDRYRVSDLVIKMGLRVTNSGLVMTREI